VIEPICWNTSGETASGAGCNVLASSIFMAWFPFRPWPRAFA
jgi:hypothetical protein